MRVIQCVLGFVFFLTVLLEAVRGKTCHSGSQCREDECCVTRSSFIGGCRTRGRDGGECIPNSGKSGVGDMYLMSCPCLDELICVPEAIIENKEAQTVEYLNSTCQTKEALLSLYKRLLGNKMNPGHLLFVINHYKRQLKDKERKIN